MKVRASYVTIVLSLSVRFAAADPSLVFSGYIDYPAHHDYRIEIVTYPSGLISRITTYAGELLERYEEMIITKEQGKIRGIDKFQNNLRTIEFLEGDGSLQFSVVDEDLNSHNKSQTKHNIQFHPGKETLFEDEGKRYLLFADGTLRIESKKANGEAVIVRDNQIFDDGWYRSDWKKSGVKTIVKEYTTMEIPGDWVTSGGGEFTGGALNTAEPISKIENFYILDTYLGRHIFLPFIFGLKTGSY
jgi:hypothetical protein